MVTGVKLRMEDGELHRIPNHLELEIQPSDFFEGDIRDLLDDDLADLALGETLQGKSRPKIDEQGVSGGKPDPKQGRSDQHYPVDASVSGHNKTIGRERLLEDHNLAHAFSGGQAHNIEGLIEQDGISRLKSFEINPAIGGHPHLAAGHNNVHGGFEGGSPRSQGPGMGDVDGKDNGITRRGGCKANQLIAKGLDFFAGFLEGLLKLSVHLRGAFEHLAHLLVSPLDPLEVINPPPETKDLRLSGITDILIAGGVRSGRNDLLPGVFAAGRFLHLGSPFPREVHDRSGPLNQPGVGPARHSGMRGSHTECRRSGGSSRGGARHALRLPRVQSIPPPKNHSQTALLRRGSRKFF